MLTQLHIQNFKAWKDTKPIRMAPLTVIFGANSSGKSSLGHLLLALKQTAALADRKRSLHLGDAASLIDLGSFADCLHAHDVNEALEFSLKWRLPKPLKVTNIVNTSQVYEGTELQLESCIRAGKHSQPEITKFTYSLLGADKLTKLRIGHGLNEAGVVRLEVTPLELKQSVGRKWEMGSPEKFYRFSDATLARYENAGFLADFVVATERIFDSLSYLGPLRKHPERMYQWSGNTPADVGQEGENTIAALLAAQADGRKINRRPKGKTQAFDVFIADWLKTLKVIHSFQVVPVAAGRKDYEVLIQTHAQAALVKLTDVGFGISQVLPALVQAFYAPPNSTVWMEQPEIHLHPQVQAELADVFISAIKSTQDGQPRNVQLVVESHSEHFLTRLQRRMAEGAIGPTDIAIYFCNQQGGKANLEELKLNLFGDIENWPANFFGDEMADVAARTKAAMARKIKDRAP
jgi:predicted ATPase